MRRQVPVIRWKPIHIRECYYEDLGPGHAMSRGQYLIPAGGGGQVKGSKNPPTIETQHMKGRRRS